MSHKILVSGQGRSGSSALWFMVHEILLANGVDAERSVRPEEAFAADSHAMKWHSYREDLHEWADIIVTPRRDLREAVDSYERALPNRVTDLSSLRKTCEEMILLHGDWKEYSDYEMVYERFRDDPAGIVAEIADVIGLDCDPSKVLDKVGYPPAKKPFRIPQEFVRVIEDEYGWWLRKYGYLPEVLWEI